LDYRLLILALGAFSIGTDSYVVAGILPQIAKSFSTSVAAAAQFVSVYSVSYAVFTPMMATIAANWPRRRVLLIGLLAFAGSNVLTATAPTFELALAGRALAGFGGALFVPAASGAASALVSPERRGRALAVVLAGVSGATALGAPIGTLIASLGDWHTTLWFVGALGALAAVGVVRLLPDMPATARVTLRERFAPLHDLRVTATLGTTLLVMFGVFLVYTYLSVIFDRVTLGKGPVLAVLMSIWGIGATIGSLKAGSLTDRFGNRRTLNVAVTILAADFAFLPWTGASFGCAAIALAVWGMCGWGLVVSQQHRLVALNQRLAPLLLALNASVIYLAIGASGAVGALLLRSVDAYDLPLVGAILIAAGGLMGELAYRLIRYQENPMPARG
jgi:MFS transporter, DHA1 family, inner membrane transport protein